MLANRRASAVLVALLAIAAPAGNARAQTQTGPGDDYAAARAKAVALAKQQNWLEALPLFEDLAKRNITDTVVMGNLAQCLVDRSATLQDQAAASKDRIRAKGLLETADQSGDRSPMSQNLLDALKNLPANGEVTFAQNADVDATMKAGEAAFGRGDFDQAIKNYSHALELDPRSYLAALFVGDSYFAEGRRRHRSDRYWTAHRGMDGHSAAVCPRPVFRRVQAICERDCARPGRYADPVGEVVNCCPTD